MPEVIVHEGFLLAKTKFAGYQCNRERLQQVIENALLCNSEKNKLIIHPLRGETSAITTPSPIQQNSRVSCEDVC